MGSVQHSSFVLYCGSCVGVWRLGVKGGFYSSASSVIESRNYFPHSIGRNFIHALSHVKRLPGHDLFG